ncbi:unnamed protein product [Thelazia callipaeda]|uniref:LIM zinc-binding domain-containing protein n=1 Tax=Thelazia callipaeda TaxID=103827 RepID=A0A0N5CMY1_THECL|nr:unnamed protein product [Thelazia callipaeda]
MWLASLLPLLISILCYYEGCCDLLGSKLASLLLHCGAFPRHDLEHHQNPGENLGIARTQLQSRYQSKEYARCSSNSSDDISSSGNSDNNNNTNTSLINYSNNCINESYLGLWSRPNGQQIAVSSSASSERTSDDNLNSKMYDQHPPITDNYSMVIATSIDVEADFEVRFEKLSKRFPKDWLQSSSRTGQRFYIEKGFVRHSTNPFSSKTENADYSYIISLRGSEGSRRQQQGHRLCIGCLQEIRDPYVLRVDPDLEFHAGCLKVLSGT